MVRCRLQRVALGRAEGIELLARLLRRAGLDGKDLRATDFAGMRHREKRPQRHMRGELEAPAPGIFQRVGLVENGDGFIEPVGEK